MLNPLPNPELMMSPMQTGCRNPRIPARRL